MGIACKIHIVNNEVDMVEAPNGEPSILYKNSLERTQDKKKSLDIWTLPYTIGFKNIYGDWENSGSTLDLDENGEPLLRDVLNYSKTIRNQKNNLSKKDISEIANNLYSLEINSIEDLYDKIVKAFYKDGLFKMDKDNMISSGLYTESEADNIVTSEDNQNKVKSFIEKLEIFYLTSTDNTKLNKFIESYTEKSDSLVVDTTEIVGIGKFKSTNPFDIERQLASVLGGVEDRSIFLNNLSKLPVIIKDRALQDKEFQDRLYSKYSSMKRIPTMEVNESGELEVSKEQDFFKTLQEVLLVDEDVDIAGNLKLLLDTDEDIWSNNIKEIKEVVQEVEQSLINNNIDVIGLSNTLDIKSRREVIDFLDKLELFTNNLNNGVATEQDLKDFSNSKDLYFDNNLIDKVDFEILPDRYKDKTIVKFKSEEREIDNFKKHSLLSIGENLYHKVNVVQDIDNLYNTLYNLIQRNHNLLPKEAYYPVAFNRDNSFNLGKLNNIENQDQIIRSIKKYITKQVYNLDTEISPSELGDAEKMVIYKKVFKHNLNTEVSTDLNIELSNFSSFKGNTNYLTGDFKADFFNYILKEKFNNSLLYQDVLKHFNIDNTGISLTNEDIHTKNLITLMSPDNTIFNNLKEYTKISKEKSLQGLYETPLVNKFSNKELRNVYVNNNKLLPLYKGLYESIEGIVYTPLNSEPFLRIGKTVYEKVGENVGQSFYKELPNFFNPFYKDYSNTINKPSIVGSLKAKDYIISKVPSTKINTLVSKTELDNINAKIDECI